MAYTRSAITVLTSLFVLTQLCSAKSPAAQSTSDQNKVSWPLTGAFMQNGRFQNSGETSNGDELRERRNVVNIRRTCANLSNQRLRNELLIHISKQASKIFQERRKTTHQESGAKNTRRAANVPGRSKRHIDLSSREQPEGARKRIVYPITVKNKKHTLKFIVNAAEVSGRQTVIKLWLFNEKNGCSLRSEVKVDISDSEKENVNCVDPMIKGYHELAHGRYAYDSEDERWISFDISQLTTKVLRNVKGVCKTMDTAKLIITVKTVKCSSPKEKIQNPRQPYLEILPVTQSTPLECTPGETRCCRQKTTVSSKQVASDILHPLNFRAFYCRGTCEGAPHNGLCCVPTKTSSISVLSLNHEGYVALNVLPDVLVQHCGCR